MEEATSNSLEIGDTMPYVVRPRIHTQHQYNVLYRVLFDGCLPKDHHNCDGVDLEDQKALNEAMDDLYTSKHARKLLKPH